MINSYLAEFAVTLGAIFLIAGFYRLTRTRPRRLDGSVISGNRQPKPSWGFILIGLLLLAVGGLIFAIQKPGVL